jgi:Fe2+ transport system protein B
MALWEVSGRDEQIAAKGDRLAESANSFRSYTRRVISGEDLSATYLDLWVERKFARLITDLLNTEERARVDDLARTAVRRYQQHGSQNERTVEELIYERVESLKTHLVTEAESKAMSDLHQQNKLLEAGLSQSNHLNDALRRENLQLKADLAASRSKELSPALRSAIDSIPADLRESIEGDDDARIVHMLKVKAMAFKSAAEFYQKFVFDLVDKLVKLVNPSFKRLHLLVAQAAAELNIPLLRWNDPEIAQGDSPEKP